MSNGAGSTTCGSSTSDAFSSTRARIGIVHAARGLRRLAVTRSIIVFARSSRSTSTCACAHGVDVSGRVPAISTVPGERKRWPRDVRPGAEAGERHVRPCSSPKGRRATARGDRTPRRPCPIASTCGTGSPRKISAERLAEELARVAPALLLGDRRRSDPPSACQTRRARRPSCSSSETPSLVANASAALVGLAVLERGRLRRPDDLLVEVRLPFGDVVRRGA